MSAYKKWKAGERDEPKVLIAWGVIASLLFASAFIVGLTHPEAPNRPASFGVDLEGLQSPFVVPAPAHPSPYFHPRLLGLADCQNDAREGLNTLHASVQLVSGQITLAAFDKQFRGTYLKASSKCLTYLSNDLTTSSQLQACDLAGHYASDAGAQIIGVTVAKSKKEAGQRSRRGLADLRQATANWKTCFPGEAVPSDLH